VSHPVVVICIDYIYICSGLCYLFVVIVVLMLFVCECWFRADTSYFAQFNFMCAMIGCVLFVMSLCIVCVCVVLPCSVVRMNLIVIGIDVLSCFYAVVCYVVSVLCVLCVVHELCCMLYMCFLYVNSCVLALSVLLFPRFLCYAMLLFDSRLLYAYVIALLGATAGTPCRGAGAKARVSNRNAHFRRKTSGPRNTNRGTGRGTMPGHRGHTK